jgi:cytochrome c-type protein NapC
MRARLSGWWKWIRRPSASWAAGSLLGIGFVAAIVLGTGFTKAVDYTNSLSFCTSCHAMQAFVYEEYAQTTHYSNNSGVRTTCADCHVPRAFVPKMMRKIQATFVEVPSHLLGTINTEEKFEAHRARLAESVWAGMEASDSRECRACQDRQNMVLANQRPRARTQHLEAMENGETCIACHKGIAHRLPAKDSEDTQEDDDFTL